MCVCVYNKKKTGDIFLNECKMSQLAGMRRMEEETLEKTEEREERAEAGPGEEVVQGYRGWCGCFCL